MAWRFLRKRRALADAARVDQQDDVADAIDTMEDVARPTCPPARVSQTPGPVALSTRVVYQVGFKGTPAATALNRPTIEHLHDLCVRLRRGDESARVVLVTSGAGQRAAKSQVAAQLACLLADTYGARVLALEADPERPALHAALGFQASPGFGLSEQLRASTDGAISIVRLTGQLHVLVESAGSAVSGVSMLTERQALLNALLCEQRRDRDFIILDGPVLGSTECTWASAADGVVVVVAPGTKPARTLDIMQQYLPHASLLRIVEAGRPGASKHAAVGGK